MFYQFPITAEEDFHDRLCQQHEECGCEGVAEPCECRSFCPLCEEIAEARRYAEKEQSK